MSILSPAAAHRVLGALFCSQSRGLIEIAGTRRRVGEHGHEMGLNFECAAADVE